MALILASASPRRRELLEDLGLSPTVRPADVDESRRANEAPTDYVCRLACAKAQATLSTLAHFAAGDALIAADTIVHLDDDEIFGKPANAAAAAAMLRRLSGVTHQVSTGVCVIVGAAGGAGGRTSFVDTTDVTFYELGDDEIAAYVASGEPADKAGAYGVQATGRLLVRAIRGDYYNVVGLPVARVIRVLDELGYESGTLGARLLSRRGD